MEEEKVTVKTGTKNCEGREAHHAAISYAIHGHIIYMKLQFYSLHRNVRLSSFSVAY
jgi:hypothetical protein